MAAELVRSYFFSLRQSRHGEPDSAAPFATWGEATSKDFLLAPKTWLWSTNGPLLCEHTLTQIADVTFRDWLKISLTTLHGPFLLYQQFASICINLLGVWNKVSQKPKSIMALNQKRLTLSAQLKFSAARWSFGAFHWTLGPLGRRNFVPLHPGRHSPRRPPERSASRTQWTKSPWNKIRPQLVLLCCS